MRRWSTMALGAGLALAARGQVELAYTFNQRVVVISQVQNNAQFYDLQGTRQPAPGGGTWSLRPAPAFAGLTGEIGVRYALLNQPAPGLADADRDLSVDLELSFHGEAEAKGVYYYAYWEVDGRAVASRLNAYTYVSGVWNSTAHNRLTIKESSRRGTLHVYLFQDGRSLAGVGRKEMDLAPLRAAVDAGDVGQAVGALHGLRPGRELPVALLEQIAQLGDMGLLEAALTASPVRGRDLGAVLIAAVKADRVACVDYLLGLKANPNAVDADGEPVLNAALSAGSRAVAEKLVAAGADLAKQSKRGYAPVDLAFSRCDVPTIQMLLDHGLKWPGEKGAANLFGDAVRGSRVDLVALFLSRGADPNQLVNQSPVLILAAMRSDTATLDLLLKAGAKPDILNPDHQTAVMGAAYRGDTTTLMFLLRAGASLEVADVDHRTAPSFALLGGHPALALELANLKAPTDLAAARLLHDALLRDAPEVVDLMISRGTGLALELPDFDAALDRAMARGRAGLVRGALAHGFDPNRRIYGEWTAAALAKRYGQDEISRDLAQAAGPRLQVVQPVELPTPAAVILRGRGVLPAEVEEGIESGQAEIDVFVDAKGEPVAPVVRLATHESIGRAALRDIAAWRFSALPPKTQGWRRVVIPFAYSSDPLATRTFQMGEVTAAPVLLDPRAPSLKANGEGGVPQAAMVRFVVTRAGAVTAAEVVESTAPDRNATFLAHVRALRFSPGKIGQVSVATQVISLVLDPGGCLLQSNTLLALATPETASWPLPTVRKRESLTHDARGRPYPGGRGIAVVRFVVNNLGFTGNIQVLGATSPDFGKRIARVCNGAEFEGAAGSRALLWVLALGDWSDARTATPAKVPRPVPAR